MNNVYLITLCVRHYIFEDWPLDNHVSYDFWTFLTIKFNSVFFCLIILENVTQCEMLTGAKLPIYLYYYCWRDRVMQFECFWIKFSYMQFNAQSKSSPELSNEIQLNRIGWTNKQTDRRLTYLDSLFIRLWFYHTIR